MNKRPSLPFACSIAGGEQHAGVKPVNEVVFNLKYFAKLYKVHSRRYSSNAIRQSNLPPRLSLFLHHQLLAFHQIPLLVQQLHIQDAAHVARTMVIRPHNVCFIPNRVPHKIAVVIQMQKNFLLRQLMALLLQASNRRRDQRKC